MKILVVDDSSMSRRMMRRIVESAGHDVIEAEEGASNKLRGAIGHLLCAAEAVGLPVEWSGET
mgnify:CR=1 FL=1